VGWRQSPDWLEVGGQWAAALSVIAPLADWPPVATLTRAMGSPTANMKPVAGRKRDSLDKGARFYQR